MMKQLLSAFVSGLLFAVGLAWSGMTDTRKVIGFLDVAGNWDPSLLFVMGGAVAAFSALYWTSRRVQRVPIHGGGFSLPAKTTLDASLVLGSILFGIGWGIGGYCPGPALVSLGGAAPQTLSFVAAMVAGFAIVRLIRERRVRHAAPGEVPGG